MFAYLVSDKLQLLNKFPSTVAIVDDGTNFINSVSDTFLKAADLMRSDIFSKNWNSKYLHLLF